MGMKKLTALLLTLAICLSDEAASFYYNSFTTNTDAVALGLMTNSVSGAISQTVSNTLNSAIIASAGGLTTNNYQSFADTNGAAQYQYVQATNFANTNIPAWAATTSALTAATNSLWTSLTNFSTTNCQSVASNVFAANPSGYLTKSATNNITALGSSVVSSITSAGGFTVSSVSTASGIQYTLTASGTNNVNVTNLNATTLASYGALTTNQSSWTNIIAPINDWTNAQIYTNGLLKSSVAAATYQPIGSYLTAASSLNYNNLANPPVIPSTNGFVGAGITNGLATTNWVLSQGYINSSALVQYATTGQIYNALAPLVSISTLNSASNSLLANIVATSNAIAQYWPTNQPFLGSVLVSSNMTVSLSTNGGVITATLGSWGGAVSGVQPLSTNLNGWSAVPTNSVLLTTNIVTSIVAGTGISTASTPSGQGQLVTISATVSSQSPAAWQSATFMSSTSNTNIVWATPLVTTPTNIKAYSGGTQITPSLLTATGNTGFSMTDTSARQVTVIGICY